MRRDILAWRVDSIRFEFWLDIMHINVYGMDVAHKITNYLLILREMRMLAGIMFVLLCAPCTDARLRLARLPFTPDTVAPRAMEVGALDSLLQTSADTVAVIAENGKSDAEKRQGTPIMGEPEVDAGRMCAFVREKNPGFDCRIAEAFIEVGRRYGVRGDIAFCQSILETGWFKFTGGTAVTADQHNYCGLGVTRLGLKGAGFDTVEDGVTAQIQHLYAYATKAPLPEGERLLDPRFGLVNRGVAGNWEDLNMRWAANGHYAERIMKLFEQMQK